MNVVLLPLGFTGHSSSVGKSPPMTSNDAFYVMGEEFGLPT